MATAGNSKRIAGRSTKARSSRELQRYAAAAAAAAVGGAGVADAEIISSTGLSISVSSAATSTLNLTSGNNGTGSTVASFDFETFTGNYPSYNQPRIVTSNKQLRSIAFGISNVAANLSSGDSINSSLTWPADSSSGSTFGALSGSYAYAGPTNFTEFDNTSGYIGIRFRSSTSSAYNYGWISYTGAVNTGTITGWGYDNSGAAIEAGAVAVPEPSAFALLAAGTLAGTAAVTAKRWRKRKSAA